MASGVFSVTNGAAPTLKAVAPFAKFFLDKPNNVHSPMPVYNVSGNENLQARGITNAAVLSLSQEPYREQMPDVDLVSLAEGKPDFYGSYTISSATAAKATIVSFQISPRALAQSIRTGAGPYTYTRNASRVDYVTRNFKYYMMDLMLMISIETSPFTQGRIRGCVLPPGSSALADPETYGNDVYGFVLDFRGTGLHKFYIPSQSPYIWATVPPLGNGAQSALLQTMGTVTLTVQTPPLSPDTTGDSTVYVNVFYAAANLRVARFIGWETYKMINAANYPVEPKLKLKSRVPEEEELILAEEQRLRKLKDAESQEKALDRAIRGLNAESHMILNSEFANAKDFKLLGQAKHSWRSHNFSMHQEPTSLSGILRRGTTAPAPATISANVTYEFKLGPEAFPTSALNLIYPFLGFGGSQKYTFVMGTNAIWRFMLIPSTSASWPAAPDSQLGALYADARTTPVVSMLCPYESDKYYQFINVHSSQVFNNNVPRVRIDELVNSTPNLAAEWTCGEDFFVYKWMASQTNAVVSTYA
jgi:hypothetical protein